MDFMIIFGEKNPMPLENLKKEISPVWQEIECVYLNLLTLIYPKSQVDVSSFLDTKEILGCIDGWGAVTAVSNINLSVQLFFKAINKNWPVVEDNFTGCFSGFLFDKNNNTLKLFTDVTGIYPVYYCNSSSGFCVAGTSLITIGRVLKKTFDLCGIIQRLTPPDFINYGDRTILKDVNRLLSGEMVTIDKNLHMKKAYDSTLFGSIQSGDIHEQAESIWEIIKSDVSGCVNGKGHLYLGMSGGWDARIIAGAIKLFENSKTCMTFGMRPDEYEVKLAKKCAKLTDATFCFCDFTSKYFPTYDEFSGNMLTGEGLLVTPWLSVLEAKEDQNHDPILLGDMFEALVGRNLKKLTSRESRKTRFLNPKLTKQFLEKSTKRSFIEWSSYIIEHTITSQLKLVNNINLEYFHDHLSNKSMQEMLREDLEKTISRLSLHEFPYSVLYEELFSWYTHGQSMGRQFLCLKKKFSPLAPTMSLRTLRATSRIDPILRADGILLHGVQLLPDLREYSKLPSASIPFISSSFPLFLKNIVWGLRSKIDQKLMRRAMLSRNGRARQRVLKTIDFVKLNRLPDNELKISSWYKNGLLKNPKSYSELVYHRGRLETWPVPNMDIIGPASTCILIDLVRNDPQSPD